MKTWVILLSVLAVGALVFFAWRKMEDYIIEKEIERIKIPDDEGNPPPSNEGPPSQRKRD